MKETRRSASLLAGLRALGIDDETMVIVYGDHGEAFGEHPGNFAHTMFIHEENLRVPYVIAAPGAVTAQRRVQRVASTIDTAPTVLDLLGLPAEALHQGTSLLRPDPRMALFFTDYSIGWLGLADGCWKYSFEMDSGRSRLFDVCDDPAESRDRAGEFPERVSRVPGAGSRLGVGPEGTREQVPGSGWHGRGQDRRLFQPILP